MSENKRTPTPEQVSLEELHAAYAALLYHVLLLEARWSAHQTLFGQQSTFELLHDAAHEFFDFLEHMSLDTAQLCLLMVADPATSSSNRNGDRKRVPNLTFRWFEAQLKYHTLPYEGLSAHIEAVEAAVATFRDRRNWRIAHADLATHLDTAQQFNASREQINRALDSVRLALHELAHVLGEQEYDTIDPPLAGDANALLLALRKARYFDDQLSAGNIDVDTAMKYIGPTSLYPNG